MLRSYRLDFGHELRWRRSWEVSYARWAPTPHMGTVLSRNWSSGRVLCVQRLLMKEIARKALAMRKASVASHVRVMNRLQIVDTWRTMISRTGNGRANTGVTNCHHLTKSEAQKTIYSIIFLGAQ